jgi:hypothetical protein
MEMTSTPPAPRNRTKPQQQLIEDALASFVSQHPEVRQAAVVSEIPTPLRWAGLLAGAVITATSTAAAIWVISTISDVQLTVTRIDERIAGSAKLQEERFETMDRRLNAVEDKLDIAADIQSKEM